MARSYRRLAITVALIFPLFSQISCETLLENGFNITKPSWLFNGTLKPETAEKLPRSCVAAYTTPINCNVTILMSPNLVEKNNTLENSCNPECATSLLTFERGVRDACQDVNLTALDLDVSWIGAVIDGEATILLYWKQCLRDLETNRLCEISDRDFMIAWAAASSESATAAATKAFCADNCLTQTVVLNAPGGGNLMELRDMCSGIGIEGYPFIDAMVFANLIEDKNGTVVSQDENGRIMSGSESSGSGRVDWHVGLALATGISLLYILTLH